MTSAEILEQLGVAHQQEREARETVDRLFVHAVRAKIGWTQIASAMDVSPEVVRMRARRMVDGHRLKFPVPRSGQRRGGLAS